MNPNIPTEVYLAFLDRTVAINWAYHALLMTGVWFVLVPIGIVAARFFKAKPTSYGIETPLGIKIGKFDYKWLWWTVHYSCLYVAITLALAGMMVAMVVSGGFSGSTHAVFGLGTIMLGCLQIVAAWLRGSHGGKYRVGSDPDDPSTWHGDHFDMTRRRRWFEAYHKTAGYFTITLALGAAASGLMQYWMPVIAIALGVIFVGVLVLSVLLEGKGYRQDTYRSVYGSHPNLPYNKARQDFLDGINKNFAANRKRG